MHRPIFNRIAVAAVVTVSLSILDQSLAEERVGTDTKAGVPVGDHLAYRAAAIKSMIAVISDSRNWSEHKEIALEAARALGVYRADEAVPELVKHLTVSSRADLGERLPGFEDFPVAQALLQIGLPSVDPLLAAVADNENNIWIVTQVLKRMLPAECAKVFVKNARLKISDAVKSERLHKLEQVL